MDKRLQEAVENAEEAFWASIVESYPEIETGDFDFGLTNERDLLNERSVQCWLEWNKPATLKNPIQFFVDGENNVWKYYSGSFWSVQVYNNEPVLLACPAMKDGTPDINEDGEVNATDVSECEQHHLDFVNANFTRDKFRLYPDSISNGVGQPYVIPK